MGAVDIAKLTSQVKSNCDISDAKFWGTYSICGLLLRLREQFRKETGRMPWEEVAKDDIAAWIAAREELWHQREGDEFVPLSLPGGECSPFDAGEVNAVLEGEGIVYGAGIGITMKPSFFLARLASRRVVEGFTVYVSGDELVRDLSFYPAMLLDNTIFVRKDALALTLWEKFEEIRQRRHCGALLYAFTLYGIGPEDRPSQALYRRLQEICDSETEPYVYHEVGEAFEGKKLGQEWKEVLARSGNRRVEFFLRGVKDVLADTSENGMIRYMIDHDARASLAFYVAFLGGFRKVVFPEIQTAFAAFMENPDWSRIEEARKGGYRRAAGLAERVLTIYATPDDREHTDEMIERDLIAPAERSR